MQSDKGMKFARRQDTLLRRRPAFHPARNRREPRWQPNSRHADPGSFFIAQAQERKIIAIRTLEDAPW